MTHTTHTSVEPAGHVAVCTCGWERFGGDETTARRYRQAHEKQHRPREERP